MINLRPFHGTPQTQDLRLRANVDLRTEGLFFVFELSGRLEHVLFPEAIQWLVDRAQAEPDILPRVALSRKDRLWEHTCFEAFISAPALKRYYELNMSPAKEWAVYHFNDYREGMTPEYRLTDVEAKVSLAIEKGALLNKTATLRYEFGFDVASLQTLRIGLGSIQNLQLGLTAVIEMRDHSKTYWALKHTGDRADFHQRASFILQMHDGLAEVEQGDS